MGIIDKKYAQEPEEKEDKENEGSSKQEGGSNKDINHKDNQMV